MKRDDLVSVAVIIGSICVSVYSGVRLLNHPVRRGVAADAGVRTPEEAIYRNAGVDYRASDWTFLLLVDSHCPYSRRSMPFYRTLVETAKRRSPNGIRVVALSTESRDELRFFLERNGVRVDVLVSLRPDALTVQRTPTLILVDRRAHIQQTWVGSLSKMDEDSVMMLVERHL